MRTAIFPGSFDPITLGHMDIIERGSKIFEKLVIVVMVNPVKQGLFEMEERIELIREEVKELKNVEVESYWGLLVDYMKENEYNVLLKGLRNTQDFTYEYDMESINRQLSREVESLFLMSDRSKGFISSSMVKQIAEFNGELSGVVSENVKNAIINKKRSRGDE